MIFFMFTNSPSTSRQILTVTSLNRLARTVLEGEIGLIWLSAEISNFVCAASGHWYFTLKDNKAQVRAAMFKGANRSVRQRPKEGDKVLVRASVGLYEARGDYQLVVEHMETDGEGALKQAFEALKAKLNAEGLFSSSVKKPLPPVVNTLGVITSSSGAALHDVLSVMKRRSPQTEIIVYPSMVQGEAAPNQLIHALQTAIRRNEVDALLITRGGGSLEDLWCFNNEQLAREIAACPLPTVSAVGHEVDFTISDFVADLRAPTPSAAAELLSQDTSTLLEGILQRKERLVRAMNHRINHAQQRYALQRQKLNSLHPSAKIQNQWQALDRLQLQLNYSMERTLKNASEKFNAKVTRLERQTPANRIDNASKRVAQLSQSLKAHMLTLIKGKKRDLAQSAGLLQSVSPLSTLSRGYSITFSDTTPVTSIAAIKEGDELKTRVTDGEITSKVVVIKANE
jgi:exodeoxyribonuclease VII large subunit